MPITIQSNVASLLTQRRLADVTTGLRTSYERLSSGLRINHSSDDAAGLSVASQLKNDSRVYSQGLRNVNDGLALLDIAEGSLRELQTISIRQRELAEQAANGTYSNKQRLALHKEAEALTFEFNRIVQTTSFNGDNLIDTSLGALRIQGGYGEAGGVVFNIGEQLARTVGTGTFQSPSSYQASGDRSGSIVTGDFNGDGLIDMATADYGPGNITTFLGNGDGTFRRGITSVPSGRYASRLLTADLNGDGRSDLLVAHFDNSDYMEVMLGTGTGSFTSLSLFQTPDYATMPSWGARRIQFPWVMLTVTAFSI